MKKVLAISTAIAMLTFSGAAFAGNHSTQVQAGTFLTSQTNVQVGNFNRSTQVQALSAFSSQSNGQGGFGNTSTQVQIGTLGSFQTNVQITP